MAEPQEEKGPGGPRPDPQFDPASELLGAASRERADAYLEAQTILVRLQAEELTHELQLRHWSLRFGNVSAVMKAALEIALAFIFVAFAAAIAAAMWTASRDDSLVIENFSVPPEMAARGLTGEAVAASLEDRLGQLQNETDSARPANTYAHGWGNEIKVQIPDTGVSISEAYGLLTAWLGHQTHISGEVWRDGNDIVIAAHAGTDGSAIVRGSETKFAALVERAAEGIYARTQPYRYAVYEAFHGRVSDARTILKRLSVEGPTPSERAWAFLGLGVDDGEIHHNIDDTWRSLAIVPDQAIAWQNIGNDESVLQHAESALAACRKTVALLEGGHAPIAARAAEVSLHTERAAVAEWLGDFTEAAAENSVAAGLPDYESSAEGSELNLAADLARDHDARGAAKVLAGLPPDSIGRVTQLKALSAFEQQDWREAIRNVEAAEAAFRRAVAKGLEPYTQVLGGESFKRLMRAGKARAYARLGDFARARALISATPTDCYICLRARGQIDGAQNKWNAARSWFARAVASAPSVPFAYADWGEMLLHKGDYEGAMAKFAVAHSKGPHFADPLEMWGEALMQENRSDLAVAKFEEANKYAPNWGRLHLEWGRAFAYLGRRDEANREFAIASRLDLSPTDAAALARLRLSDGMGPTHG